MNAQTQRKKAQSFLSLHKNRGLIVLPNIWNPVGARILEAKGYPAVATASMAISASLGYQDGEKIKFSTLLDVVTRIANSVDVPVTADIETGYAKSTAELEDNILRIIDSGVVGVNIEDGLEDDQLRSIHEQSERIAAIREVSDRRGIHLVINARTDAFLGGANRSRDEKIEETVTRAKTYSEAGADCIYPIGPGDRETLVILRRRIASPLNVLGATGAEPLLGLQAIGINRVSFGPFVFRSCLKKLESIAHELGSLGDYKCFSKEIMSGVEIDKFLRHGSE